MLFLKSFVKLVSQCFGDTVAGQVARNISQCREHTLQRPKSLRDKLQDPLPKVELGSTFRATCLATILVVAGMLHGEMFRATCPVSVTKTLRDKLFETFRSVTAP